MAVWDDLVGQAKVEEQLAAAARDADALVTAHAAGQPDPEASKMTHAWLFTGPPGSLSAWTSCTSKSCIDLKFCRLSRR